MDASTGRLRDRWNPSSSRLSWVWGDRRVRGNSDGGDGASALSRGAGNSIASAGRDSCRGGSWLCLDC